jgi:hypothetical protein
MEPEELIVAASELEEGKDCTAQQHQDVQQEDGEIQELPCSDDEHLQGSRTVTQEGAPVWVAVAACMHMLPPR